MGSNGEHEVDGLLIDSRGVGFLEDVFALRVAEDDEASFAFDELAEGVVLALEVHFGLNDLASSWDVAASDLLVAASGVVKAISVSTFLLIWFFFLLICVWMCY